MKTFIVIGLFLSIHANFFAQDPLSSHTYLQPLPLNPALAGVNEQANLQINYRNQFPAMGNVLTNYRISFDQSISSIKSGIGAQVSRISEGGGVISKNSFDAMYNYQLQATRYWRVNFGIQTTLHWRTVNYDGISTNEIPSWAGGYYAPEAGFSYSKIYPDFSIGIHQQYKEFHIGFAVHHLFEPSENESNTSLLYRKYSFYSAYSIPVYNRFQQEQSHIKPFIFFQQQAKFNQLSYGALYESGLFDLGLWGRHELNFNSASIILSTGIKYLYLYIGYSFDMMLSNVYLSLNNYGIHELTLKLNLNFNEKRKRIKAIKCPKI